MKNTLLSVALLVGMLALLSPANSHAQSIESMPPVIVKTVPESGAKDIAPGVTEIKVTFSKEMRDGSWSWANAWAGSAPASSEKPHYDTDHKTCILKVSLEPNKTYGFWLNSGNFGNFKDQQGHSAVPYLLVFQTREK